MELRMYEDTARFQDQHWYLIGMREDVSGLQEAVRVLKPEGRMVILVPAHQFLGGHHDDLAHHLRRYSRKNWRTFAGNTGLKLSGAHITARPLCPRLSWCARSRTSWAVSLPG